MKTLRYAGLAAVLALIGGGVALLSQSHLLSFFALLATHLALLLAVAFIVLSVGTSSRDPSDPPD